MNIGFLLTRLSETRQQINDNVVPYLLDVLIGCLPQLYMGIICQRCVYSLLSSPHVAKEKSLNASFNYTKDKTNIKLGDSQETCQRKRMNKITEAETEILVPSMGQVP